MIPLYSSVTPAASSPSSPSVKHIIGSSWRYQMSSDITFAPPVPFTVSTLASASASVFASPNPTDRASGPTTRCGALTSPTRRLLPVQHDLTTPRARARAARLRANEAAERREDLAALITTPVSHPSPRYSILTRRTDTIKSRDEPGGFFPTVVPPCLLLLLAQCCYDD